MQNNPTLNVSHSKYRTYVQVPIAGDPNAVDAAVRACLSNEGFHPIKYTDTGREELVWKKGTGFATAMKFIQLTYQPNLLVISAWTSSGIGSLTFFEMSLDGGYGLIPKKSCMKSVKRAAQAAQSVSPQNYVPQQPQQNYVPQQPQQNYVPQQPQQNYVPQQPQQNYVPQQPQQNYAPQQPQQNYVPQQPQQNYVPQQPQQNYVPQQPQQNYVPQQPQQNYVPQQPQQEESPASEE